MEYFIDHKRELCEVEIKLLAYILSDSGNSQYLPMLDSLKVIARCGCGNCPTILLGEVFQSTPVKSGQDLVQYMGANSDGVVVGVTLMTVGGRLSELDASSFSGEDVLS